MWLAKGGINETQKRQQHFSTASLVTSKREALVLGTYTRGFVHDCDVFSGLTVVTTHGAVEGDNDFDNYGAACDADAVDDYGDHGENDDEFGTLVGAGAVTRVSKAQTFSLRMIRSSILKVWHRAST